MQYKIITAGTANELAREVNELMSAGLIWEVVGSHQVVEIHRQNRYAGTQHIDTIIKAEYSQTVRIAAK